MTSCISRGDIWINHDELLASAFLEFHIVFSKIREEIHNTGYCLGVGSLSFDGDHLFDRSTVHHETSRALLGIVVDVFCDEACAFLVRGELAIGDMLGKLTKRILETMLDTTFLCS